MTAESLAKTCIFYVVMALFVILAAALGGGTESTQLFVLGIAQLIFTTFLIGVLIGRDSDSSR